MSKRGYHHNTLVYLWADSSSEARAIVRAEADEWSIPVKVKEVLPDTYGRPEFQQYQISIAFRDEGEQWAFLERWND